MEMTAPISSYRKRRTTGEAQIPKTLLQWFSGEIPFTWLSAGFPFRPLLPAMWAEWKRTHPDARPPANYEWLDNPDDPRQHRNPEEAAFAREHLARHGSRR
jgi:hypothetical protein